MMDKMARRIGESFTWVMDMVMEGASKKQKALLPLLAVLMMGFPLQNHYNRWMAAVFDDTPISKQENKNLNKAMMGGVAPSYYCGHSSFHGYSFSVEYESDGSSAPYLMGITDVG